MPRPPHTFTMPESPRESPLDRPWPSEGSAATDAAAAPPAPPTATEGAAYTGNAEVPVEPAALDTFADTHQETAGPATPRRGGGPVEGELLLEDLSGVVYAHILDGYPRPPVTGPAASKRSQGLSSRVQGSPLEKSSALPAGLATELLQEFSSLSDRLAAGLAQEPVVIALPVRSNRPGGYRLAGVESEFLTNNGDGVRVPRTLAHAVPGRQPEGERAADALDRLELVRLVGAALEQLHAEELFTSGIELDSFAYALDPRPAVMLLEPDGVRRIGGEFLTHTRPRAGAEDCFDSDRYEFAVLAHRLLVDAESSSPYLYRREHVPGLSVEEDRHLWGLWERAAGPLGSRPQIGEWMGALHP